MNQSPNTIFKRLTVLEQQVQKLKVQAYFNLPKNKKTSSLYPEEAISKALQATRAGIWELKYVKKLKGISRH